MVNGGRGLVEILQASWLFAQRLRTGSGLLQPCAVGAAKDWSDRYRTVRAPPVRVPESPRAPRERAVRRTGVRYSSKFPHSVREGLAIRYF